MPKEHNWKYTKETKLSAVLDDLLGRGSMRESGSRVTICKETTPEGRIRIIKRGIHNGNDYGGTALKYQVSYQQVYTWTKKYCEIGEAGLEDRR